MSLHMTNDEIIRSYKEAKNPSSQIKVLAELNACRKSDIEKILVDGKVLKASIPAKKAEKEAAVKAAIEKLEADGKKTTVKNIVEKTGLTNYAVINSNAYLYHVEKKKPTKSENEKEKQISDDSNKDSFCQNDEENHEDERRPEPECENEQSCSGCINECEACGRDFSKCVDFEGFGGDILGNAERAARGIMIAGATLFAAIGAAITYLIVKKVKKNK